MMPTRSKSSVDSNVPRRDVRLSLTTSLWPSNDNAKAFADLTTSNDNAKAFADLMPTEGTANGELCATGPIDQTAYTAPPVPDASERGHWGQIMNPPKAIRDLVRSAEEAGAWSTGIASNRRGRGTSVNADVYAYDLTEGLVVVQVRQCQFHPRRPNRVRKDYYLVGRNENGNAFAHPIDSPLRSPKYRSSIEAGVNIALAKIWGCAVDDLPHVVRNGDVAFVPIRRLPKTAVLVDGGAVTIRESHHVRALMDGGLYRAGDDYYVSGRAEIKHSKHQHPTARVKRGVWRVQPGLRAPTWDFSAPTAD